MPVCDSMLYQVWTCVHFTALHISVTVTIHFLSCNHCIDSLTLYLSCKYGTRLVIMCTATAMCSVECTHCLILDLRVLLVSPTMGRGNHRYLPRRGDETRRKARLKNKDFECWRSGVQAKAYRDQAILVSVTGSNYKRGSIDIMIAACREHIGLF